MIITSSTALMRVDTQQYPVYLAQVRAENPDVSFSDSPSEDLLAEFGFAAVRITARPAGDVVTEGTPELVDGEYQQSWVVREFTDEEKAQQLMAKKAELQDTLLAMRAAELEFGFNYTDDNGNVFGIQLREQDRINLLGLKDEASDAIAADSAEVQPFRTLENVTIEMSPQQMVKMCRAALARFKLVMGTSWHYRDAIEAATTMAELPELPAKLVE